MCELLAISSQRPSAVTYSLSEFAKHGGLTHGNKSGWGIAYFHDRDAFLVKEAEPASDSPWVQFIASQELASTTVLAHVRLATVGQPALHNTHPFRRALGGRTHVFAHNGTIKGLPERYPIEALDRDPVGETDSEHAFCLLLERLGPLWRGAEAPPSVEARLEVFTAFAAEAKSLGTANFLYADGDTLFVHAHKRVYEENGGFSDARAPGLSVKNCRSSASAPDWACDGLNLRLGDERTMIFASVPLDDFGWEPLPEGTALAVRLGEEVARRST